MSKKTTITLTFELTRHNTDLGDISKYVRYTQDECGHSDTYAIIQLPESASNMLHFKGDGDFTATQFEFKDYDQFMEKVSAHCNRGYDIASFLADYGHVVGLKCVSEDIPEEEEGK